MSAHPEIAAWHSKLAVVSLVILLAWETLRPFFPFFVGGRDQWLKRGRHGLINLAIGIVNALVTGVIFSKVWLSATTWAAENNLGILRWIHLPVWTQWVAAVLMLDAWTYFWHRLNHVVPFFWQFHKFHHVDRSMDVTTASRFHAVEIIFSSILRVPILLLIGCAIEQLALYELFLFGVVQFHHANVALPERIDRSLRMVIVTPFIHKVHHSVAVTERDSNYSSLFSWWDRLFRTFRRSRDPRKITFGVEPLK
ncbi:MAG: sterol desaturase family protein [Verrucomicrobiota bacterium]